MFPACAPRITMSARYPRLKDVGGRVGAFGCGTLDEDQVPRVGGRRVRLDRERGHGAAGHLEPLDDGVVVEIGDARGPDCGGPALRRGRGRGWGARRPQVGDVALVQPVDHEVRLRVGAEPDAVQGRPGGVVEVVADERVLCRVLQVDAVDVAPDLDQLPLIVLSAAMSVPDAAAPLSSIAPPAAFPD